MSNLNRRGTKLAPVEEQKAGKPTPLRPKPSRETLDPQQAAFEERLRRKHEKERNQTARDIKKQRAKG